MALEQFEGYQEYKRLLPKERLSPLCQFQKSSGLLHPHHGQPLGIQQAHLHQERGLVSVDVLGRDLATLEFHDRHVGQLHVPARGRDARQNEIQLHIMGEAGNGLDHQSIRPHGEGDPLHTSCER